MPHNEVEEFSGSLKKFVEEKHLCKVSKLQRFESLRQIIPREPQSVTKGSTRKIVKSKE